MQQPLAHFYFLTVLEDLKGSTFTITSAGSWTSEYDCVTNEWRAYGNNTTNQAADDPVIGRHQRFAVAFLNGKTYSWGGQNAPTVGDSSLPFVREYQADPVATAVSYGAGCNGSTGRRSHRITEPDAQAIS